MKIMDGRVDGFLALRHDDYEAKGWALADRSSLIGVSIANRLTTGRGMGQYVLDRDPKVGDICCANFWRKSTRDISGWAFAWPSVVAKPAGGDGAGGQQGRVVGLGVVGGADDGPWGIGGSFGTFNDSEPAGRVLDGRPVSDFLGAQSIPGGVDDGNNIGAPGVAGPSGSGGGVPNPPTVQPEFQPAGSVDTVAVNPNTTQARNRDSGPTTVYPLIGMVQDTRFEAKQPVSYRDVDPRLWPLFPRGFLGMTMADTREEKQIDVFMPTDPRIVAPHANGDGQMGSLVCDLTSEYGIDAERTAPMQSLARVMRRPTSGPLSFGERNAVAWNLGMSGLRDCRGGVVWSSGIFAVAGSDGTGPLHVGMKEDVHKITSTPDNEPINSLHIHTGALFLDPAASTHDGPINFESDPYPSDVGSGNKKTRVHLQWKEDEKHDHVSGPKSGRWCLWAESQFEIKDNPCRPPPTTPSGGGGRGPVTTGPGGGPGSVPTGGSGSDRGVGTGPVDSAGRPTVSTLDPHPNTPAGSGTSPNTPPINTEMTDPGESYMPLGEAYDRNLMDIRSRLRDLGYDPDTGRSMQTESSVGGGGTSVARSDMELQTPGTSLVAQPYGDGMTDIMHTPNLDASDATTAARMPTVLREQGYSRQSASGTNSCTGTPNPTIPTPTYTHQPCTGLAGGGTADGGGVCWPPEMVMGDALYSILSTDDDRPTLSSGLGVSIAYKVAAPGVNWACGLPDLYTGGIASGYSWRVRSGALQFSYHDAAGTKDAAVHFTTTQRIGFRSDTDYWGDFAHANTADRVWTVPDLTANVTLNSITGGLGTVAYIPFFAATGALTQDIALQYASGVLKIGESAATTGSIKLWHASTAYYASIAPSSSATASADYTLPVAPPAGSGYYLAATTAGVMSWTNLATTAVTSLTGTANQVLVNGTSGIAKVGACTLTTPQDIATTSTPQFARIGLGVAADASISILAQNASAAQLRLEDGVANNTYDFRAYESFGTGYLSITAGSLGGSLILDWSATATCSITLRSGTQGSQSIYGYDGTNYVWQIYSYYNTDHWEVDFGGYDATYAHFKANNSDGLVLVHNGTGVDVNIPILTASTLVATDASKNLSSDTTTLTPQFLRLGIGAAADATAALNLAGDMKYTAGNQWYPSADSTTALQFTKADGSTQFLNLNTTEMRFEIGATPVTLSNPARLGIWVAADTHRAIAISRSDTANPHTLFLGVNQSGAYVEIQGGYVGVSWLTHLVLQRQGGNVGIGTATPTSAKLQVYNTYSSGATAFTAAFRADNAPTSACQRSAGGMFFGYSTASIIPSNWVVGVEGRAISEHTSGTLSSMFGLKLTSEVRAAGNVTTAYGVSAVVGGYDAAGTGTITTAYALYGQISKISATITNAYGLYIAAVTDGGTLNRAIYTAGGIVEFLNGGTENLRLSYSAAVYASHTVDSSGYYTIAPTGYQTFLTGGITVNDAGGDYDTRIEGDSLAYMLFLDASAATENIALLTTAAPNWQSMDRGIFIGDCSTAPTGNPASGGFLYVESGALKYRGSSGTISVLGPA